MLSLKSGTTPILLQEMLRGRSYVSNLLVIPQVVIETQLQQGNVGRHEALSRTLSQELVAEVTSQWSKLYIQFPLYKGVPQPGLYNRTMLAKATPLLYLLRTRLENIAGWFLQLPVGHCKRYRFFKEDKKSFSSGSRMLQL